MIDTRGFLCPMPVVMVRKCVLSDAPETLSVLADDRCAVENITRFANSSGYQVTTEADGPDFRMTLQKQR